MPVDSAIQTALIVIAIAASVQTLVIVAAALGAAIAWKRIELRYQELTARVDEAIVHARRATDAVHRVTDRATDALDQVGHVVGNVGTFLTTPRTLMVAGAASVASKLLMRWRRSRAVARSQA